MQKTSSTTKRAALRLGGYLPRNLPAILRLRAARAAKRAQAVRS